MPLAFSKSTAELVVQVVAAVHAAKTATSTLVQTFCDLSQNQADDALSLASDLGLIANSGGSYKAASHLVQFTSTPDETRKAAVLRIVLESFEPFIVFRQRLVATASVDQAARETKSLLDLTAHREDIKDTLVSLGTYTGAIVSLGGGKYDIGTTDQIDPIHAVAEQANSIATAEHLIRNRIGAKADRLDRTDVVVPLAEAFLKAKAERPDEARAAVADAARAVESFLAELAGRMGVSLAGANGIGQKVEKFRDGNRLPKKIVEGAKYLGQVRNAADHGVDTDPDVGAVWSIRVDTGMIYVMAACAFIASCLEREDNGGYSI